MFKTLTLNHTLNFIQDLRLLKQLIEKLIQAINDKSDISTWINDQYFYLKTRDDLHIKVSYVDFSNWGFQLAERLIPPYNQYVRFHDFNGAELKVEYMEPNNQLNYSVAIKVDTSVIKPTIDGLVMLVSSASYRYPNPVDDVTAKVILTEMVRDYLETTAISMKINHQYLGYSLVTLFQSTFPAISILANDAEFMQRFSVLFSSVIGYYQQAIEPAVIDVLNHGNVVTKVIFQELDPHNVLWVIEGMWHGTAYNQDCDA